MKAKAKSIFKDGPAPPGRKIKWEDWGKQSIGEAPDRGPGIHFFGSTGGPMKPTKAEAPAPGGEADYAEARKDAGFAQLCKEMGISVEDAIRFHKLQREV